MEAGGVSVGAVVVPPAAIPPGRGTGFTAATVLVPVPGVGLVVTCYTHCWHSLGGELGTVIVCHGVAEGGEVRPKAANTEGVARARTHLGGNYANNV